MAGAGAAVTGGRGELDLEMERLSETTAKAALLLFAWSLPASLFGMQAGAGLMALALLASFLARKERPAASALDLPIAFLVAAILLSLLFSPGGPASFRTATSFWVSATYFLVWRALRGDDGKLLKLAVNGALVLAGAACLLGLGQALSGSYPAFQLMHPAMDESKRLVPISGQPAAVGFFFSRLTFAHVMLFMFSWSFSLALEKALGKKRLVYLAAAVAAAAGIFAAQARTAWLALVFSALGLCFWRWPKRRPAIAGLAVLAILAGLFLPGPAARLRQSFSGGRDWTRLVLWKSALELATKNPLTGVGYGNFQRDAAPLVERLSREAGKKRFAGVLAWAHSNPLTFLAETGALGLTAFCMLFVAYFRRVRLALKKTVDPPDWAAAFVRGSAVAVGAFLIVGLFHDNFFDGEVAFNLWFTLGASLAACRRLEQTPSPPVPAPNV
jgi:O-antigen ligase